MKQPMNEDQGLDEAFENRTHIPDSDIPEETESEEIELIELDYCEVCNSQLPEHLCENCGTNYCHSCWNNDRLKCITTDKNEVKEKLFNLRESARSLYIAFQKHGFNIVYYEGYQQDKIIPRWYTSYAWILTKADINFEIHMSSSQYSNRAKFYIEIWKGVIPNLLVSQERLDFIKWDKVRVLSYLEELDYSEIIVHLEKIIKALT